MTVFRREPNPERGVENRVKSRFPTYMYIHVSRFISEMIQDRAIVTGNASRISYAIC